ncbi:MAG: hypothetical protein ACTJLM_05160 [Ehrlichia sp.]
MDPTQRAGQTKLSNIRSAKKFGRGKKAKKKTRSKLYILLRILNFLFNFFTMPLTPSSIMHSNLIVQSAVLRKKKK